MRVQVWLVAGDCFLIGLAPVLVHMSKGPDGAFPFHPVSINLLVEATKTVFATVVIAIYVRALAPIQPPFGATRSRVSGVALRAHRPGLPSTEDHARGEQKVASSPAGWLDMVQCSRAVPTMPTAQGMHGCGGMCFTF